MPSLIGGFGKSYKNNKLYSIKNIVRPASLKGEADAVGEDNNNDQYNKEKLGSYLAGLIEGDGCIYVPSNNIPKNRYPLLTITFTLVDIELAKYLCNLLNIGKVYDRSKYSKHCNLLIGDKKGILIIINLINGYFRTPKYEAFIRLTDWINNKYEDVNFKVKELDNSSLDSNAWLSGFSDADSNFSIIFSRQKVQLEYRFDIQQNYHKNINLLQPSYYDIINKIAIYFESNLLSVERLRKYNNKLQYSYNVRITSKIKLLLVIKYFEKYPLLSSKFLNYNDWSNLYKLCIKKKSFSHPDCYKKAKEIRLNYNSLRLTFNWDHLKNNLYLNK